MVALQQIVVDNMKYFTKTGLSLVKLHFCGIPHERIGSNIANVNTLHIDTNAQWS